MDDNIPAGETTFPFIEMGTSFIIGLAVGFFLKKFFIYATDIGIGACRSILS